MDGTGTRRTSAGSGGTDKGGTARDGPGKGGYWPLVEGPVASLLLVLTGRRAGLASLAGPGAVELGSRWRW